MENDSRTRRHTALRIISIVLAIYATITLVVSGATLLINGGTGPAEQSPATAPVTYQVAPITAVCDTDQSCAEWDAIHGIHSDGTPGGNRFQFPPGYNTQQIQPTIPRRACWTEFKTEDPKEIGEYVCGDPDRMPANSTIVERSA